MVETNALHRMVCKCTQKCGECQINPCFHENFSMMPIRLFCCSTIVRQYLVYVGMFKSDEIPMIMP